MSLKEKERLPTDREGFTHRFRITDRNGKETSGYIQVGLYEDGRPGELFLKIGKPGDETAVWDQFAILFSAALQYGAPLENLCSKFVAQRFEPSGSTSNTEIRTCSSISDYIAKYLMLKFRPKEEVLS